MEKASVDFRKFSSLIPEIIIICSFSAYQFQEFRGFYFDLGLAYFQGREAGVVVLVSWVFSWILFLGCTSRNM